jgi:hypothetical protein
MYRPRSAPYMGLRSLCRTNVGTLIDPNVPLVSVSVSIDNGARAVPRAGLVPHLPGEPLEELPVATETGRRDAEVRCASPPLVDRGDGPTLEPDQALWARSSRRLDSQLMRG